ncbi:MAG: hypothetical protein LBI42_01595 [Chitinispirillales bacterium]|jgi:hypothetical protein|nr:hypothetical protein [Chitinispirillales bacterium]
MPDNTMFDKDKIRTLLFSFAPTRELLFFIFQKRTYNRILDKKIAAFIKHGRKSSSETENNLIVSLTTFPQRITEVKYAVYSLLNQTLLPQRIVLWLAESQFPNKERDLPNELLAFKKHGLDIRWCEDLRSYKKLIPSLEQFPDSFIATADDDIFYEKTWLEKLWNSHLENPESVICHVAKAIEFDADNSLIPFVKWKRNIKDDYPPFLNVQLGAGGCLYHKKYLHEDVFKRDLFMKLAPYGDDLWFYFMAILNGTPVHVAKNSCDNVKYVNPYREYGFENGYTLLADNVNGGGNDQQLKNIIDYYKVDLHSLPPKAAISIP